MAKKKIGCAEVKDGVARGWFNLPENLKRGVYELLGEYQGNEVYQPSYDLKYLIIGLGTEFQGIEEVYQVDEYERKLIITGRLVGYNEMNEDVGLENQKIGFKIGDIENPLNLEGEERSLDAVSLTTVTGDNTIRTGDNGYFRFECYVPEKFKDWEYQLYIKYGGNYDYVSCVKQTVLRIGYAPTFTRLEIFPSNHLHPQSGMILRASVYLQKDIDSFGNPKDGAERITHGTVLFRHSNTGQDGSFITLQNTGYGDGSYMTAQPLSTNNGWITHRYNFNRTNTVAFQEYVFAKYSGSREGIGYKPSNSRIIHLTVDENGDTLTDIRMQLATLDTELKTVFYVYGENPDKKLTFDYGSDDKPVPIGYSNVILDEVD